VSKEQLSTLKREREASRGFTTVDLFGRMVHTPTQPTLCQSH